MSSKLFLLSTLAALCIAEVAKKHKSSSSSSSSISCSTNNSTTVTATVGTTIYSTITTTESYTETYTLPFQNVTVTETAACSASTTSSSSVSSTSASSTSASSTFASSTSAAPTASPTFFLSESADGNFLANGQCAKNNYIVIVPKVAGNTYTITSQGYLIAVSSPGCDTGGTSGAGMQAYLPLGQSTGAVQFAAPSTALANSPLICQPLSCYQYLSCTVNGQHYQNNWNYNSSPDGSNTVNIFIGGGSLQAITLTAEC